MNLDNNLVKILGKVAEVPVLSHEVLGEKFYIYIIEVLRISGVADMIPVMVSDRLVNVDQIEVGKLVSGAGQFRSFNRHEKGGNHLVLSVFVQEMCFVDEIVKSGKANEINLDGYICKKPVYRETPLGREIADFIIAVNRAYGKSDYIPCITWGRNAKFAANLEIGEHVSIRGRIQSRIYLKTLPNGTQEERVAYEVSINQVNVVEEN